MITSIQADKMIEYKNLNNLNNIIMSKDLILEAIKDLIQDRLIKSMNQDNSKIKTIIKIVKIKIKKK